MGILFGGASMFYLAQHPGFFERSTREMVLDELKRSPAADQFTETRYESIFSMAKNKFQNDHHQIGGSEVKLSPHFWDDFEKANQGTLEVFKNEYRERFNFVYATLSLADLKRVRKFIYSPIQSVIIERRKIGADLITKEVREDSTKIENLAEQFYKSQTYLK